MGIIRYVFSVFPEGKVKRLLRSFYYFFFRDRDFDHLEKLNELNIIDSGISFDGTPFVKLGNGLIFYGYPPNERQKAVFRYINPIIREKITKSAFNVANDIVIRYMNPKLKGNDKEKYYQAKEGDTIVELGGYIVFYTLKLAKLVGTKGKVIAIEPKKENLILLRKNIEENNLKNVIIVPKAIWKEKGKQKLYISHRQANSMFNHIVKPKKVIEVETDTLDNILSSLGIEHVDFIISEINGAEIEALEGMENTLINNRDIFLYIAAFYRRGDMYSHEITASILKKKGFNTIIENGNVFASRYKII